MGDQLESLHSSAEEQPDRIEYSTSLLGVLVRANDNFLINNRLAIVAKRDCEWDWGTAEDEEELKSPSVDEWLVGGQEIGKVFLLEYSSTSIPRRNKFAAASEWNCVWTKAWFLWAPGQAGMAMSTRMGIDWIGFSRNQIIARWHLTGCWLQQTRLLPKSHEVMNMMMMK